MIELQFDSFSTVYSFFRNKKQLIPALSVINGNYPGRVFVDHEQWPNIAIVWATGRWMYLEGDLSTEQQKSYIKQFFQAVVMPECEKRNETWFEIYTSDSKQLDEFFLKEIDFLKVNKHFESVYSLDERKFLQVKNAHNNMKNEVQVEFRDFNILPESYWKDALTPQKTVGVVIKNSHGILSIAKNNGFIFGKEYFIDIDTFKAEERRKGYATLAAIKLIDYFLERGMFPLWETTNSNIPSQKLALKLGFEPVDRYPVFAFFIE